MAYPEVNSSWPNEKRAGLDIGSREVKLVAAGPNGLISHRTFDSVSFLMGLQKRGGLDYGLLGLDKSCPLVVTGYGRAALPSLPGVSEIRAHFLGAKRQTGLKDFTLVELGGQDSKMVHVENGRALDFMTNDRCAAGTGRYLENMARMLGVGVDRLAQCVNGPVEITNTCATFGETEILGRLVEGRPPENIMAGVNLSVARRVAQMVRRLKPKLIVFCGGVAKNRAVVKLIGETTGCRVLLPPHPQLNGALGCCFEGETVNG